jgi:carbon monoxide dehydrogenase subunit G
MGEHGEETIVIDAPAEEVMDVITDYEAYPEWADVKSARVVQRGAGGLATEVTYEVDVPLLGRASYTLAYRYAPGDAGVSWVTKDARGAVSNIVGEYLLDDLGDGTTRVTYRLDVELGVLLPGFVRTQGAKRVMENALERLKRRVELG